MAVFVKITPVSHLFNHVYRMMMKKCSVGMVAWVLVIVGALNWGLIGGFHFNLVNTLLGSWPMVERIVYILVGVGAIVDIAHMMGMCKKCCGMGGSCKGGSCKGEEAMPAGK